MRPAFDTTEAVVATRVLRNDGTYPGVAVGAVLVPAGTPGEVVDHGTYLQDRVVYAVCFDNGRIVGCLEPELARRDDESAGGGGSAS